MKAVIQRVSRASVAIDGQLRSSIERGLLVFIGITDSDREEDSEWLSNKILQLRIFNDENGVMNSSVLDIDGEVIIVSQFTLMASTKKGNRPSYIRAAGPEKAIPMYERFIADVEQGLGKKAGTGIFGADMKIDLQNDGPVTIVIDTELKH